MSKEQQIKPKGHIARNKFFYLIILILLLSGGALYISKGVALKKMDKQHQEELIGLTDQMKSHEKEVIAESRKIIETNSEDQLRLMLKTFVWAIRSEMLKQNYDQVNQYILQLIKEKKVKEILITDHDGQVVVSSNRKQEEQKFTDFYDQKYLSFDDVNTEYHNDSEVYLSVPIMAFNNKLGSVFMIYEMEHLPNQETK